MALHEALSSLEAQILIPKISWKFYLSQHLPLPIKAVGGFHLSPRCTKILVLKIYSWNPSLVHHPRYQQISRPLNHE